MFLYITKLHGTEGFSCRRITDVITIITDFPFFMPHGSGYGILYKERLLRNGAGCAPPPEHFGYKGGRRHRRSDRTVVYAPGVLLPGVAYIYSGNAGYYGICRHIFCHYGPGSNYGVVADGHALQYGGV